MNRKATHLFFILALCSLIAGILFGILGALHFTSSANLNSVLPFYKLRPLHVTLVISWIVLAACGGIYTYLPRTVKHNTYPAVQALPLWHVLLFVLGGAGIIMAYAGGNFGGKEYLEFPGIWMIPVFAGWGLFAVYMIGYTWHVKSAWPVYLWQWLTGAIFMIITLCEANFWRLPHFGSFFIRDLTVQWKANGALVGCWNMLVYGTATYLVSRLSTDKKAPYSRLTYFMFFLGFVNLLFNWGHHVYPLPGIQNIKYISYAVSLTELIILGKIIRDWRLSAFNHPYTRFKITAKFLYLSEKWVFLNLCLAILISIPAINVYTHGTHVTVAHAMGTTIGINTTILLASLFYIFESRVLNTRKEKLLQHTEWFHISLVAFWTLLLTAGILKSYLTALLGFSHSQVMQFLIPVFIFLCISAVALFAVVVLISLPLLQAMLSKSWIIPQKPKSTLR